MKMRLTMIGAAPVKPNLHLLRRRRGGGSGSSGSSTHHPYTQCIHATLRRQTTVCVCVMCGY
jgi:hypothetical protein